MGLTRQTPSQDIQADTPQWSGTPGLSPLLQSPLLSAAAPMLDRSWALERSWEVQLARAAGKRGVVEGSVPTLRGWREATLAGRLPAVILNATTVEIKSSHVPFISHPKDVVKLIEKAAKATVK